MSQKNIRLINGSITEQLPEALERHQPELIFLDADHRGSAVKEHVDIIARHSPKVKAIVIHDIYWSRDMYKCWQELSTLPQYPLCIDIFQAGILFTHFQGEKQHFVLKF